MTGRSRVAGTPASPPSPRRRHCPPSTGASPGCCPVTAAVAIVVGVGELIRRSPIPAALSPLLGAAGALLLLTKLYAAQDPRQSV